MKGDIDWLRLLFKELPRHPVTGHPLQVLGSARHCPAVSPDPARHGSPGKGVAVRQDEDFRLIEAFGWRLFFAATSSRGLAIVDATFGGVFFIFESFVPWVGNGPFFDVATVQLTNLEAGPLVVDLQNGFIIAAVYRLGTNQRIMEAFLFDADGNFVPQVIYLSGPPLDFIPIYVDFDIVNPSPNSAAIFFPHPRSDWHLAVPEFDYARLVPSIPSPGELDDRLTNVLLFNDEVRFAWVDAFARPGDRPEQYVAPYLTFDIDRHPRMSIDGEDVVSTDLIYEYLIRQAVPGLYGPRFTVHFGTEPPPPLAGLVTP